MIGKSKQEKLSVRIVIFSAAYICHLLLFAQGNQRTQATITQADTLIEFGVTSKEVKVDQLKFYQSFKNFKIHNLQGEYLGKLLDGKYQLIVKNQLLEQGQFSDGLKDGEWKYWYDNGLIRRLEEFENGLLNGDFSEYDQNGQHIMSGTYKNGTLHGKVLRGKTKSIIRFFWLGQEVTEKEFKEKDRSSLSLFLFKITKSLKGSGKTSEDKEETDQNGKKGKS
ncbi:hypothetical protein SAMN05421640_2471 [Ekhidna lutea]|uniref:MORN repeat variant n=1 Tax=Ekhidna lutea TaxID=447679 RepID=A0A239K7G1_EKHLU|nr:hypothetical protein [Ekhidna lutea]SNT13900.1 hypothetical protein SAMN05421640_2471 [Ekhidna lutea]